MKVPLISIITITYNAENILADTIRSILHQTEKDFEYIIIDGQSKDNTPSVIKEQQQLIEKENIPFRYISEPDKGIYDAMNKGIRMAKGSYIWFMNAGDRIYSENIVKNIKEIIAASPVMPSFIYGETNIADEKGNILGKRRLSAPEKLTWKSFKNGMLVCHQAMIVNKDIVPEFDLKYNYSSDIDWSIKCLKRAKLITNTHLTIATFLNGGISKKKMRASLRERFDIMSKYYGFIPTVIRHFRFILRASYFKLVHGWI